MKAWIKGYGLFFSFGLLMLSLGASLKANGADSSHSQKEAIAPPTERLQADSAGQSDLDEDSIDLIESFARDIHPREVGEQPDYSDTAQAPVSPSVKSTDSFNEI